MSLNEFREVMAEECDYRMAERAEHFTRRDGTREPFVLPVMGVFELRDGKVVAWRDYFERSHLQLH
jgi:limonene-1,2-epoxide hydrolase